jgi:hypothetical protein
MSRAPGHLLLLIRFLQAQPASALFGRGKNWSDIFANMLAELVSSRKRGTTRLRPGPLETRRL